MYYYAGHIIFTIIIMIVAIVGIKATAAAVDDSISSSIGQISQQAGATGGLSLTSGNSQVSFRSVQE